MKYDQPEFRALARHPTASSWIDGVDPKRRDAHLERSYRIVATYGYDRANAMVEAALQLSPEATTEGIVLALLENLPRTEGVSE